MIKLLPDEEFEGKLKKIIGEVLHDYAYFRQWDDRATCDLIDRGKVIVSKISGEIKARGEAIAKAQDAKTLKAVGKYLTVKLMLQSDIVCSGKTLTETLRGIVKDFEKEEMPVVD